ncbi:hypothetical protein D3C78_799910 [compost metagenome]
MGHRSQHALHQHVGVGRDGEVETEELVLGVQGYRGRSAQAEEVDLPGLDHHVHGAADLLRVKLLAGTVERGDGTGKDLLGVGCRIVIGLDGAADIGRATGQALRQLQLELGVTADAERTAEAVDGRFADLGRLGQCGNAETGGLLRVEQDDFGDFAFGLVQLVEASLDLLQEVSHAVHGCVLGSRRQPAGGAAGFLHSRLSYCRCGWRTTYL